MQHLRAIMQEVISLTLLAAGLYVIIHDGHNVDSQRWASATVSGVMIPAPTTNKSSTDVEC
jgi:hypothetical protein